MPHTRNLSVGAPLYGDAFAALYRDHSEAIFLYFLRRIYEPEGALDLTAETFAQALVSRRRFHGAGEAEAVAWIYGIAKHQLSRYFRKGAAERRAVRKLGIEIPPLAPDELERLEELAGLDELRRSMRTALGEVSREQRQALQLRVVDELPYPEVARRLGISEQSARARVSRGLRALSTYFDSNPRPEEAT